MAKQLHAVLTSLCKDEALALVKNSNKGPGQGLDVWRRLCHEYEPNTAQSNQRLLKKFVSPNQVDAPGLRRALGVWDQSVKEYKDRTGKVFDDDYVFGSAGDVSRRSPKPTGMAGQQDHVFVCV